MADVHPTRAFLNNAHRIIVKVGTAVVSREIDGRLAIGRLGSLFEQIEALLRKGKEVILVTSGAVGVGRQKLRHQKLMSSSMKDLEEARSMDMDNKACASIGQSGLMSLYDALFGQLDVACSQLLVTDSDFRNPDFRKQLRSTVDSLLKNKVIPVFNENDAISTRTAPYKDSTGIFWDNDSLAALLSLELKVDALILMSDVDGLYTGPPSKPGSKIIHTYLKEKHDEMVTFGEKSRVGRGGMMAKVEAAWMAASAGIPVVIASGYISNNLVNVFEGKLIGTLFHKDAPSWETKKNETSRIMALSAREASRKLQALPSVTRKKILYDIASALETHEQEIIEENNADVRMAEISGTSPSLIQRLKLKPGKISQLAQGIRAIADMEEPMGETLKMTELAEGLVLEKQTWPLGVLLVIFEARPDAMPQIASLAIRSGNGLLLKGGKEAAKSNAIIHRVITEVIPSSVGQGLIGLITTREEISDLLKLDDVIDLVIPRGSNELVTHIKQNTKIAVLGHADGVCHIFVDEDFDYDMALKIILDAKLDYPAACNAVETLLIHENLKESGKLEKLMHDLHANDIYIYGGDKSSSSLNLPHAPSLHYEYGCPALTLEIVPSVEAAIEYIHAHGSGHTESIITNNKANADLFLHAVDSAVVMHNSSTRFSDGFRFGLGAEVGISTSRIHARGPVGVEGLLTSRWILRGHGHVVNKDKDIKYTHKSLSVVKSHLNGHCNSQRDMYHAHSS